MNIKNAEMKVKVNVNPKRNMKTDGSIIVSLTSIVFISLLGISLLLHCITHIHIVKARNTKMMETGKLYQDLIFYLHHFREQIFKEKIQDFNQPESEFFNNTCFPDQTTDNKNVITVSFTPVDFPKPGYKKTRVTAALDAGASSASPRHPYHLNAEVTIDILSGKIPLTLLPFFIQKNVDTPTETFLEENHIVNRSRKNMVIGNIETGLDISRFLMDALKISGTLMTWRGIREKLGLESSDDPIPEGLYPVIENGIVESVVIQGDVERMIFSIDNNPDRLQVIRIIKESIPYEIRYRPGENYFICWDPMMEEYASFKEKILVNGNIWSIEQTGEAAFLENSDIQLFVSGKAVICSNLEAEKDDRHLDLRKLELTNLTVSCGKDQLFNEGSAQPEIILDIVNLDVITILQVSFITTGKFTNKNPGTYVELFGSLYCADLENNGTIGINHVPSSLASSQDNYFSTVDFKVVDGFFIHFIEEVSDEDK
jgi:hypothetical protein